MNRRLLLLLCVSCLAASCGPPPEAVRPPAPPPTVESLYRDARRLAVTGAADSAEALLEQILRLDSAYLPAWKDLASLEYEQAARLPAGSGERSARLRRAFRAFAKQEGLGVREAEVYERLCETAVGMNDAQGFLTYAQRYVKLFPYDRQYYNAGLAQFEAADFQGTVKSQKEAAAKFPQSDYIGGFYRQMGRAYMKMDRDQTAERTLAAGVQAVDARLASIRAEGGTREDALKRLREDRVGMLLLLKRLHTIYKDAGKLQKVEQLLREAGVRE